MKITLFRSGTAENSGQCYDSTKYDCRNCLEQRYRITDRDKCKEYEYKSKAGVKKDEQVCGDKHLCCPESLGFEIFSNESSETNTCRRISPNTKNKFRKEIFGALCMSPDLCSSLKGVQVISDEKNKNITCASASKNLQCCRADVKLDSGEEFIRRCTLRNTGVDGSCVDDDKHMCLGETEFQPPTRDSEGYDIPSCKCCGNNYGFIEKSLDLEKTIKGLLTLRFAV